MKQGKSLIAFVILAMAAALCLYLGVYIFNTFNTPFSTTLVYEYTVNDSAELDGILVRDELVLAAQDGIVDVVRAEAEKVGVGQTIALIYRSSQAQSDQAELEALEDEIALLEYAAQSSDVESSARLDENILQAVVALRAASALGDYSQLEDQVMDVKSSVLKRGYTYSDDVSTADLSARLKELKSQYSTLSSRTASATTVVRASKSGTFSSLVDGYETVLTPDNVFDQTPSTLSQLLDGVGVSPVSSPGKLILGSKWYFAAAVDTDTAQRLSQGNTFTLRFTGDFNQDVDMKVEQLGAAENGQVPVVFSSDRYLNQTTLLRCLRAELIFENYTGLRIPKEALHLVKETEEDSETGEETENSRLGVYALVSGRAEFKEVTVVIEGGDYYVVLPADSGRKILRAGDEILIRGTGFYDGQLLEY